jgi:hypothetical protein
MDTSNSAQTFICNVCNITCVKKNDWSRHILTSKHQKYVNGCQLDKQDSQKLFICKCGKEYVNKSGLWKHTKKCNIEDNSIKNNIIKINDTLNDMIDNNEAFKSLILEVVKNNTKLQKQILEVCKK